MDKRYRYPTVTVPVLVHPQVDNFCIAEGKGAPGSRLDCISQSSAILVSGHAARRHLLFCQRNIFYESQYVEVLRRDVARQEAAGLLWHSIVSLSFYHNTAVDL